MLYTFIPHAMGIAETQADGKIPLSTALDMMVANVHALERGLKPIYDAENDLENADFYAPLIPLAGYELIRQKVELASVLTDEDDMALHQLFKDGEYQEMVDYCKRKLEGEDDG